MSKSVSTIRAALSATTPEAPLTPQRQQVVNDVLELFSSRPSLEIFKRSFRPEGEFEDPLSKCIGYEQFGAQWFGMPKVFPVSRNLSHRILSSTTNPNRIEYVQAQEYTFRWIGNKKIMYSLVMIDLDENDKVLKLEDKWDGNDQPTRYGAYSLRRLNAKCVPWLVSVPKDDEYPGHHQV
ncbi:hypothetical protein BKA62DRAFT_686277 [Auriculariales sp. MPI-PUGE-AT-0066]|nr:hypothetical protein BKA62DRAFT_686277 [Auriculariales sp. MPI-PUGE-AT-0066]